MPEQTNNPNHAAALDHARLAGNNWRTGRDNAYAMAHGFILACVVEDWNRKELSTQMKGALKYTRMDTADQANVRKLFQHCGEVIDAWPSLPAEMRERFVTSGAKRGGYVYSTLRADVVKRDKEAEKAEADAQAAQELAELGITQEEFDARVEAEANDKAFIAACDTLAVAIASGNPLSEQAQAALAKVLAAATPAPALEQAA